MHLCIGVLNIYSVLKFALYILLECIQSDPQPQNNICQRKKLDCNFCCQHHYIGQTLKIQVKEFLDNIKRKIESAEYIERLKGWKSGFNEAIDIAINELQTKKTKSQILNNIKILKK